MIRVLQVLGTVNIGGAESRVMDIYRHIDRDRIQFDFLITEGRPEYFRSEIEQLGGRIYHLPVFRIYNIREYKRACHEFFSSHMNGAVSEYSAVHGHMTSTASIYLPIAREYGVPLTIAHARSAGTDPGLKGMATRFLRRKLYSCCDVMIACSDEAKDAVFGRGRDCIFMPNAVDTREYAYDKEERRRIRASYGIGEDDILVGHVGSFRYAKNHDFIIDIYNGLHNMAKDAKYAFSSDRLKLMLVGDGKLREAVEKKVDALGLRGLVTFTGNISPVSPYYSAFDVLLFPSIYEGMPGTVVEAQAAGLPCLISENVTEQVICTDRVMRMSLDKGADIWAEELLEMIKMSGSVTDYDTYRSSTLTLTGELMADTMYDVGRQVSFYTELYTEGKGI